MNTPFEETSLYTNDYDYLKFTPMPSITNKENSSNKLNFQSYHFIFITIEFFVFFGNVSLILLISCNKILYKNNNTTKIVLSLSITDLLLSLLVMPFTFYSEINVSIWNLGHKVCVLWLSSDLHLTTTSIFHLCSLSYERYLSVAKPIKFRKKLQQRVLILIACGWLLSFVLITLPFLVLSFLNKDHFYLGNRCGFFHNTFIIYTTVISFWLPLILMIFYGVKTMMLIKNIDRMHQKNSSSKLISLIEAERTKRAALNKINNNEQNEIQILPNNASPSSHSRLKTAIFKGLHSSRKETQAQKTLSIVLVVFIVSYFPVFTFITTNALVDFFASKNTKEHLNSNVDFTNVYNLTLNSTYLLKNSRQTSNSNMTASLWYFFEAEKTQESINFLDRIFYSTTWVGYSSAAMNPLIHLFLNSNFNTSLVNCFSFKKT